MTLSMGPSRREVDLCFLLEILALEMCLSEFRPESTLKMIKSHPLTKIMKERGFWEGGRCVGRKLVARQQSTMDQ